MSSVNIEPVVFLTEITWALNNSVSFLCLFFELPYSELDVFHFS